MKRPEREVDSPSALVTGLRTNGGAAPLNIRLHGMDRENFTKKKYD